jgi:succinate-semialdehyde dehydrogenase / glutarate-semialdehyde dehydrogenase
MTAIASINPALQQTVRTFEPLDAAALESKLALASETFARYRTTTFDQRGAWLWRSAEIIQSEKRRFAELAVVEMGKPIRQAVAEMEKCASVCRYYADRGASMLAEEIVDSDAAQSYVRYEPLGPVLAVMPWNFPYWQVFRFAAPALMAGNVGLLKHASNVPQCALAIEEIFNRAGFPPGAFQTLLVGTQAVERIIDDERVKAVTLTGSEPAGAAVARRQTDQEGRSRTRRQRSVHRHRERRSRRRRIHRRHRAHDQQRAILHRGQALHIRRVYRRYRGALDGARL